MNQLSDQTTELLRGVGVATLCTQLFKRGFRNVFIQGIARLTHPSGGNLVGPAFTLRNIPSREDLDQLAAFDDPAHPQRKGIESVPPGHVLVIDCRGETRVASGGQILTTRLKVRGAAGLVSDGPLRDSGPVSEMDFPIYCAGGSAPLNLIHHHAIDLNVPIGCGGVAVYPGDIMVGDDEGVAVIPRHLADEVARDAAEQEKLEAFILERIEQGAALPGTYPPNAQTRAAFEAWRKERGV
jgi:regulator of RNase E activity RraA